MELTNPPGRFVIRNHVSTGTQQERCPLKNRIRARTHAGVPARTRVRIPTHPQQSLCHYHTHRRTQRPPTYARTTQTHADTNVVAGESSQCWLINSGGRLKPLTQWTAMSCLWFPDKPHMLKRSITDLNVQLLNRLPVCLLTHRDTHTSQTHEISLSSLNQTTALC